MAPLENIRDISVLCGLKIYICNRIAKRKDLIGPINISDALKFYLTDFKSLFEYFLSVNF